MAAPQTGEPNFDALDELLQQAEALDQQMRAAYPALYAQAEALERSSTPAPAASALRYDDDPDPTPAHKSTQHSILPMEDADDAASDIDEDSLQAYFLRRKFEEQPSVPAWERADAGEMISRSSDEPARLPDEELFLYTLTKLNAGITDDANNAMALMDRRPGMNPLLAFLPVYTAAQNGASRERISSLAARRIPSSGESAERSMVLSSQRMLAAVMDTITEAEALQEAGYRNRQEALAVAAQNVRQRLSRLNY